MYKRREAQQGSEQQQPPEVARVVRSRIIVSCRCLCMMATAISERDSYNLFLSAYTDSALSQ